MGRLGSAPSGKASAWGSMENKNSELRERWFAGSYSRTSWKWWACYTKRIPLESGPKSKEVIALFSTTHML